MFGTARETAAAQAENADQLSDDCNESDRAASFAAGKRIAAQAMRNDNAMRPNFTTSLVLRRLALTALGLLLLSARPGFADDSVPAPPQRRLLPLPGAAQFSLPAEPATRRLGRLPTVQGPLEP